MKVPGQKLVASPPTSPTEVQALTANGKAPTTLAWSAQSSDSYDVSSGLVLSMRTGGGVSAATCIANGLGSPSYADARPAPLPGDGYYYLVRARNGCGTGTLGFTTGGAERRPLLPCP